MKEKIEQIIDRNTEGNYLLSSTDKAQMVSEIMDLAYVPPGRMFKICTALDSGITPNRCYV